MKKVIGVLFLALTMTAGYSKELSFEEFKEACKNPDSQGRQIAPTKIKLVCRDVVNSWQEIEQGNISLSESRLISSELFSDKYSVGMASYDITVPERNVMCPRFREIVQRSVVEVAKTCADLEGEDVTLEDLCRDALDTANAENPGNVETEASGRTFSVCGDSTQKP